MPFFPFRRPRSASDEPPSNAPFSAPPHRWGRWLLALAAVAALHWGAARWVERGKSVSNPPPAGNIPVQVDLLTPKPVEQAPPAPPAPPAPKAAPKPAPKPAPVLSVERNEAQAAAIAASEAAAVQAASEAAAAAQAAAAQAAASQAAAASAAAAAQAAAPGDKFDVPPSGELRYDTLVNGTMNQTGTIHWTNDGQHYEMIVSIPLPFVGPYVYSSKGHIDRFGIAPEQYSEQRGRRAADVTIFNRETKQLVYTRTPANQPLVDGAQDRFSVVMQLASLVRGAPDTYKPGVTRQFSVADNDSSEIWPIQTIGDETVQARGGPVTARHFVRLPRREGDRRRLDIWLAQSLGWLPVRIVQTEPSGMQIELLWRGTIPMPAAAPVPGGGPNDAPPGSVAAPAAPGTPDASGQPAPAQPDKP